jgi:hypothetical protein
MFDQSGTNEVNPRQGTEALPALFVELADHVGTNEVNPRQGTEAHDAEIG